MIARQWICRGSPPFSTNTATCRADFADVSLLALAERLNILQIASVDKDFAIYRLFSKRAFENVFTNSN